MWIHSFQYRRSLTGIWSRWGDWVEILFQDKHSLSLGTLNENSLALNKKDGNSLTINYSDGSPCKPGQTFSSRITFRCHDVEKGPTLAQSVECGYYFEWLTPAACARSRWEETLGATSLQTMMNAKLSLQGFWPCHRAKTLAGSSRRFKRYPITYIRVSSWLPFTVD